MTARGSFPISHDWVDPEKKEDRPTIAWEETRRAIGADFDIDRSEAGGLRNARCRRATFWIKH